jgi:predicted O-linked N-acetylglucosamine transferase (SPINDLY family)
MSVERAADLLKRAFAAHSRGNLDQAVALYREALEEEPANFDALHLAGVAEGQRGEIASGETFITRAIGINPESAEAWFNRANLRLRRGSTEKAEEDFARAIQLNPSYARAHFQLGNVMAAGGRFGEALQSYERAIAIEPTMAEAHLNRANALRTMGRLDEAMTGVEHALALKPDSAEAYTARAMTQRALGRSEEALQSFNRALALKPTVEAWVNRGHVLQDIERFDEAITSYDRALALDPHSIAAYDSRGNARAFSARPEAAIGDYRQALALDPKRKYVRGKIALMHRNRCDWDSAEAEYTKIRADIAAGIPAALPFDLLPLTGDEVELRRCAELYVTDKFQPQPPLWQGERYAHERIRIAYVSADFHDHATSHLIAELIESHDRNRFEVIGVSAGPDSNTFMRRRMKAAFDRFIDIRMMSDTAVAAKLREMEIDIAIDLKGFTKDARTGIFALRPVPLQVSYLGYPGTMGADWIDYILADRVTIPEEHIGHYSEKVVWLPDSYQPNDAKRIVPLTPPRSELGLPDKAFVFCCFNLGYKIGREAFDVWMRLLCAVEGSVLWLLAGSDSAQKNLMMAAEERGVPSTRLIFAPRVDVDSHLARHGAADLFLDTLPYNAHTTASDVLRMGLPMVTCLGDAFAGRVAASLLNAVGASDLVTRSWADYEALALRLATDAGALAAVRKRLSQVKAQPLFDTDRYRRHIEAAYEAMLERHKRGLTPESFDVPAITR